MLFPGAVERHEMSTMGGGVVWGMGGGGSWLMLSHGLHTWCRSTANLGGHGNIKPLAVMTMTGGGGGGELAEALTVCIGVRSWRYSFHFSRSLTVLVDGEFST